MSDPTSKSPSEEEGVISSAAIGDEPTSEDYLGFKPYVDALETFLTHPDTEPPLTVSVEGDWGSGKSSFLLQLKDKISAKGNLTVDFNPWRHENEDDLWAAFVLNFIRQIRGQLSFRERLEGDIRLMLRRLSWRKKPFKSLRIIAISVFILGLSVLIPYSTYILYVNFFAPWLEASSTPFKTFIQLVSGSSGLAVTVVALTTLWSKAIGYITHPLEIRIEKHLEDPEYRDRVSFISQFHNDFERILESYIKDENVFIFIDDLDRCSIPKSADLIQSLNLMISKDPRLLFIIGMDRQKVAAGVAAKYEELLPYLSDQAEDVVSISDYNAEVDKGLEFGYRYLNKFIQVPFRVPKPKPEDLDQLLQSLHETDGDKVEIRGLEEKIDVDTIEPLLKRSAETTGTLSNQLGSDALDYLNNQSGTFKEVILIVSPSLDYNPRQIKRFINLFRLRVLLASKDGLFQFNEDGELTEDSLTLQQLGKFVAISLQWPRLVSDINNHPGLIQKLEEYALNEEGSLSPLEQLWAQEEELLNLLQRGINEENSSNYRLSNVRIDSLLHISPRTELPTETEVDQQTVDQQTNEQILEDLERKHQDEHGELGIVNFFNETGGYGFIESNAVNEDVFFHVVDFDGIDEMEKGEKVGFRYEMAENGPRATKMWRL